MAMGIVHGMDDGTWKISNKTGIALISDRHLSPPTLCIYPALATHHGICNRHEPGHDISWKCKLAKRTKNEQSLLKITKMDAISVVEALLAPSGDYVLLAPSGEYNQSIPPNKPIEYAVSRRVRYYSRLPLN